MFFFLCGKVKFNRGNTNREQKKREEQAEEGNKSGKLINTKSHVNLLLYTIRFLHEVETRRYKYIYSKSKDGSGQ